MKKFYLLLTLLVCAVSMSWADSGDFYGVNVVYSVNGTSSNCDLPSDGNNTKDLGTITGDFKITGLYLKCWDDWGTSNFKFNTPTFGYYNSFTHTDVAITDDFTRSSKNGNNYQFERTKNITVASSTSASGKYTLWFYFSAYGTNWETRYIKNGNSDFGWSYTILPPAAKDLSVSGAISGTGTQTDPYVFIKGSNMTIGATQAHTDANSSLQVKFGDNAYSATNTMAVNANGNVTVLAKYHNGTADLDGAATEAKTVYYTIASYELSISAAGYSTFYDSQKAYIMPEGCEGYAFADGLVKEYDAEDVVPANTALVIKGTAGTKTLVYTTGGTAPANNALLGTDEAEAITNDDAYYFYGLSLNAAGETSSVGFYWMNATGAAFTNGAHKAYLKLAKPAEGSQTQAPRRFLFETTDTATDVESVEAETAVKFFENGQLLIKKNGVVYNVMGQIVR